MGKHHHSHRIKHPFRVEKGDVGDLNLLFLSNSSCFFKENHFSHQEIAVMLGVSKRTVENRIAEYELANRSRDSDIDDDMLDSFV